MFIVHHTLTFPGIALDGLPSGVGIPGLARFGSGLIARSASNAIGALVFDPSPTTTDIAQHRLALDAVVDGDPLVGIGLSPNSLFEAFTVHAVSATGAAAEQRVTAGNPFVDTLQFVDGFARVGVTLPVSIAPLVKNGQPSSIAVGAAPGTVAGPGSGEVWTWPLPIEAYYGSIPPRGPRPTYHDRVIVVHEADGLSSEAYFVTDGRRDVEVLVTSPAQAGVAGVRINALHGRMLDARFDISDGLLLVGEDGADALSVPLAIGLSRFVLPGRAPTMIKVQIDGARLEGSTRGRYEIAIVAE